jgi:preprotein translocase subunit SecG
MTGFIIAIHVIICVLLIIIILIQAGRGGGLVESFSGVESMFGTKTNAFLTRTTTILSVLFFLTCLSLAVISLRQSKSLMASVRPDRTATVPVAPAPAVAAKTPSPAAEGNTANTQPPQAQDPAANNKTQVPPAEKAPESGAPKAQ